MKITRRSLTAAAALAATLFASFLFAGPADARGAVEARKDSVTLVAGESVRINVLANDRLVVKRGANVRLVATTTPSSVTVGSNLKQRVVIKTSSTTKPGRYTATYKVTDKRGRKDKARVVITV